MGKIESGDLVGEVTLRNDLSLTGAIGAEGVERVRGGEENPVAVRRPAGRAKNGTGAAHQDHVSRAVEVHAAQLPQTEGIGERHPAKVAQALAIRLERRPQIEPWREGESLRPAGVASVEVDVFGRTAFLAQAEGDPVLPGRPIRVLLDIEEGVQVEGRVVAAIELLDIDEGVTRASVAVRDRGVSRRPGRIGVGSSVPHHEGNGILALERPLAHRQVEPIAQRLPVPDPILSRIVLARAIGQRDHHHRGLQAVAKARHYKLEIPGHAVHVHPLGIEGPHRPLRMLPEPPARDLGSRRVVGHHRRHEAGVLLVGGRPVQRGPSPVDPLGRNPHHQVLPRTPERRVAADHPVLRSQWLKDQRVAVVAERPGSRQPEFPRQVRGIENHLGRDRDQVVGAAVVEVLPGLELVGRRKAEVRRVAVLSLGEETVVDVVGDSPVVQQQGQPAGVVHRHHRHRARRLLDDRVIEIEVEVRLGVAGAAAVVVEQAAQVGKQPLPAAAGPAPGQIVVERRQCGGSVGAAEVVRQVGRERAPALVVGAHSARVGAGRDDAGLETNQRPRVRDFGACRSGGGVGVARDRFGNGGEQLRAHCSILTRGERMLKLMIENQVGRLAGPGPAAPGQVDLIGLGRPLDAEAVGGLGVRQRMAGGEVLLATDEIRRILPAVGEIPGRDRQVHIRVRAIARVVRVHVRAEAIPIAQDDRCRVPWVGRVGAAGSAQELVYQLIVRGRNAEGVPSHRVHQRARKLPEGGRDVRTHAAGVERIPQELEIAIDQIFIRQNGNARAILRKADALILDAGRVGRDPARHASRKQRAGVGDGENGCDEEKQERSRTHGEPPRDGGRRHRARLGYGWPPVVDEALGRDADALREEHRSQRNFRSMMEGDASKIASS